MNKIVETYDNIELKNAIISILNDESEIVEDVDLSIESTKFRDIIASEMVVKVSFKYGISYDFKMPIFSELKTENLNVLKLIRNDYIINELSEMVAEEVENTERFEY